MSSRVDFQGGEVERNSPVREYSEGKLVNAASLLTTAQSSTDLVTAGYSRLIVMTSLTGTANGDLSSFVRPYRSDGTLHAGGSGSVLPKRLSSAPTLSAGVVNSVDMYDLDGISKVQVGATNNNAATQTLNVWYALQR